MTTKWLPALLAVAFLVNSCDTTFDPIQESDLFFSVFGFLDAAADSQFIRVTPVRDSIALAPGRAIDATVTLENLASGRTTVFRDSLFAFPLTQGARIAYNFWSANFVEHETPYRLTVTRTDGAASRVTFTTPPAYPDPELLLPQSPGTPTPVPSQTAAIRIANVARLAELRIQITFRMPGESAGGTHTLTLSYLDRVASLSGNLGVQFRPYNDFFREAPGCPLVDDVQVLIAAGGPEWPDFSAFDDETLALADGVTNVENGVGFVGGVSRKTLPWDALRGFLAGTQPTCVQCTSLRDPSRCFGG